MDILSYALSKKYTNDTVIGLGALKGASCTIQDIVETDEGSVVTFKWTGTDGTVQTANLAIKNGTSIESIDIEKTTGKLVCTMSDGTTVVSKNAIADSDAIVDMGALELERDIVCNVAVGNTKVGDTLPQGMTFTEYAERVHVATLPPAVSINSPAAAVKEYGEVITTLPIKATIIKKSYTLSKAEIYDNNTLINTIVGIPGNGVISMDYSCNNNDRDMKIKVVAIDSAGLQGSSSVDIKYSRGIFYGTSTTGDLYNTSTLVRSLNNKVLGKGKGYQFTIEIPVGTKSVIIAIPSTLGKIDSIKFRESMNMDVSSTFTIINNVSVEGANGYTAIDYNVYEYIAPTSFSQLSHYDITI